ncbi:hypothetical protein TNCV_4700341 [Trichonephila clavipes]|nr:hypothetical protein TNCV_4700341 [Trichonephila clavipes]
MASYQDLSEFERGIRNGSREMGHSISEVSMKFGFSHTIISRVTVNIENPMKHQVYDIAVAGKRSYKKETSDD